MLTIEHLNCGYGKHEILHDISVTIPDKKITAIVGQSGCGKTTFLKTLNRMVEEEQGYTTGKISLGDADIKSISKETLRSRIGMVFQQPTPFRKSIRENILFAPRRHGRVAGRDEADVLVEESLRQAALWDEVKDKLDRSAHALSGGQQQRLCIARTLAMRPDVVLFDEPCSALDPISTFAVEETIRQIADSGICCVIVTHNMEQAKRVSDRTAFFYMGDMVETGTTRRVFLDPQDQRLVDYLTGRFG